MDLSKQGPVTVPADLTEFLSEMACLENLRAKGCLTQQEYNHIKQETFLTWLLANNPDLLSVGKHRRPPSHA